ncbi:SnoaL-like protein [Streptomyces sp. 2333.5]|uniref:nuclear transport factor 2 family protein n=1 Tax=unclassified Streptomyces TaxID=2593676 RepID=UPI000899BF2A|nr:MULTISPECIES: nuclear transport factor 2 family protein [unclassified Streptomyces]PJJ05524.1 SnoaL-like protein [Streptomyces sp. 2333.5]SEE78100.1 SnoaL-like domain-containing protein [Streptomyces sp. 2314.4]SEF00369.1 SnoaL-like domain-containing protein [Streptomyces sp. 2112.2]
MTELEQQVGQERGVVAGDRYAQAVGRYFEAWNAVGEGALGKAVAAAFDEGVTYTDPLADVAGHEGLAAVIAGAHAQFPGFVFRPLGDVDGHHDIARFGWELVSTADGSAPVAGFDVVRLGEDGRIRSVLGFLDRVPAG